MIPSCVLQQACLAKIKIWALAYWHRNTPCVYAKSTRGQLKSISVEHNVQFPGKTFLANSKTISITAKRASDENFRFGTFTWAQLIFQLLFCREGVVAVYTISSIAYKLYKSGILNLNVSKTLRLDDSELRMSRATRFSA